MKKSIIILSSVLLLLSATHINAQVKVLAFAGSAREGSTNKKLAAQAAAIANDLGAETTLIDLRDYPVPFYDEDLETREGMPHNAQVIRQLMKQSEVIIIASPNYNGSLTALLKNVLDWASRSENGGSSREAFKGKKFVIMCAAPGASGGIHGLPHLKAIIENIGGIVIPQQVAIPRANTAFDDQGQIKEAALRIQIKEAIEQALEKT